MTASSMLSAAIHACCTHTGVKDCTWPSAKCERYCSHYVENTCVALRSLATPTPEIVRHVAVEVRRRQFARTSTGRAFDETVHPTNPELDNARAALAAYWTSILGEKP